MKKIYVIAVLLLVAVFVMTAAIPKAGPMVVLTLRNKMLTSEAHISLNGLTAFHTYYLTARAWPVDVKYPVGLWFKTQDTTYEIRSDFYEGTVYSCGGQRSGVFDLTNRTRLTFPICGKTGGQQGEPRQEKINTGKGWPGYWDPSGANRYTCVAGKPVAIGSLAAAAPGERRGTVPWCDVGYTGEVVRNYSAGDPYSDGDVDGNFRRSVNGAQIRWSMDFLNWENKGTDYWH